jgi:hypothetical protein
MSDANPLGGGSMDYSRGGGGAETRNARLGSGMRSNDSRTSLTHAGMNLLK